MPSNLLLGTCGIPLLSTATLSNTVSTTYPTSNLFGGNKADRFELAAAASGDTRLTLQPSSGQTANFLYIARADLLKANSVGTITVRGHSSNAYSSGTTVATVSSFGSATLVGPQSDDYLTTFTTSASFAWWFVNFNASSASKCPCSKVFLGNYFDPGSDPTGEVVIKRERPTGLRKRSLYTVELSWEGIAYSKAVTMYSTFARPKRYNPVVLFTTSYHGLLSGHQVMFGRVLDMTHPPKTTSVCDVTMTFEEVI